VPRPWPVFMTQNRLHENALGDLSTSAVDDVEFHKAKQ